MLGMVFNPGNMARNSCEVEPLRSFTTSDAALDGKTRTKWWT